jgi:hypothetical protein
MFKGEMAKFKEPMEFYGIPMEFLWHSYGIPMDSYGIPMKFLWIPMNSYEFPGIPV